MSFRAFYDSIVSGELRAIATHWNAARGARLMPAWRDIDPVAIGPRLRYVWAWRYDRERQTFTGRLAGEEIIRTFERSPHGIDMRDYFTPEVYRVFFPWMQRALIGPAFMRGSGLIYRRLGRNFDGERIMMPLAGDGVHGDDLLGATFYQPVPGEGDETPHPEAGERAEFFALDVAAVASAP